MLYISFDSLDSEERFDIWMLKIHLLAMNIGNYRKKLQKMPISRCIGHIFLAKDSILTIYISNYSSKSSESNGILNNVIFHLSSRIGMVTEKLPLSKSCLPSSDPVRNAKVEANSTVQSVLQIGLKGGIFQYTNAMKVLGKCQQFKPRIPSTFVAGKPRPEMGFEEAFFCYPNQEQVADQCRPALVGAASGPAPPGKRQKRVALEEDANGKEKPPVEAVLANAMASL